MVSDAPACLSSSGNILFNLSKEIPSWSLTRLSGWTAFPHADLQTTDTKIRRIQRCAIDDASQQHGGDLYLGYDIVLCHTCPRILAAKRSTCIIDSALLCVVRVGIQARRYMADAAMDDQTLIRPMPRNCERKAIYSVCRPRPWRFAFLRSSDRPERISGGSRGIEAKYAQCQFCALL